MRLNALNTLFVSGDQSFGYAEMAWADKDERVRARGVDGELAGFAHVRRLSDTFTAGPAWFLDDLYVVPERRGQGIARDLIERAARDGADAGGGTLRWITAADNTSAQKLYDRIATRATWVVYERELGDGGAS